LSGKTATELNKKKKSLLCHLLLLACFLLVRNSDLRKQKTNKQTNKTKQKNKTKQCHEQYSAVKIALEANTYKIKS